MADSWSDKILSAPQAVWRDGKWLVVVVVGAGEHKPPVVAILRVSSLYQSDMQICERVHIEEKDGEYYAS